VLGIMQKKGVNKDYINYVVSITKLKTC
jgi:hypothetical protein